MFRGSMVAIVTPFTSTGEIDEKALRELVKWHVENETDAIVCCGTTGEASTLSEEERLRVIEICVEEAGGKTLVIAGTGTNDTRKSVYLTLKAKALKVDGCLAVVPYYNKPTQDGCIAHFKEIAKVGLPIILYHHPGRTGIKLLPQTFSQLSKIKNILAIKEASCDIEIIKAISKECPLPILSGDDSLTVAVMQLGGAGVISVIGNIIPLKWKELTSLCEKKKFDEATAISEQYKNLCKSLFLETNPQGVKYALSLMGKCRAHLRLPLIEPSKTTKAAIKQTLEAAKLI